MGLFTKKYKNVTYKEVVEMMKNKQSYQFIDMRRKAEYKAGHALGFNKNVDFYKLKKNNNMLDRIGKEKAVVLMCASGMRSRGTAKILIKNGYQEVYNFKHGIRGWQGSIVK